MFEGSRPGDSPKITKFKSDLLAVVDAELKAVYSNEIYVSFVKAVAAQMEKVTYLAGDQIKKLVDEQWTLLGVSAVLTLYDDFTTACTGIHDT
jgi:hypothetical protein